ncbi:MAG: hypothetical protein U1A78_33440 [Polyangia bacterium]
MDTAQRTHAREVYELAAVHAQEAARVQPIFQREQQLLCGVLDPAFAERGVLVEHVQPRQLTRIEGAQSAALERGDPVRAGAALLRAACCSTGSSKIALVPGSVLARSGPAFRRRICARPIAYARCNRLPPSAPMRDHRRSSVDL